MNYHNLYTEYTNDPKNTQPRIKDAFQGKPLLEETLEEIAQIKPTYAHPTNEDEKISTQDYIKSVQEVNKDLFYAILFFGELTARSSLYNTGTKDQYNVLVPLLMYAHKHYNDIPYEDWDKEDPAIMYAIGKNLWKNLKDYLKPIPELDDNLAEYRNEALSRAKRNSDQTGFYFTSLKYDGKVVPREISAIKGQFWLAHPNNRTEYMILDTVNWDNFPEPLVDDMDETIVNKDSTAHSLFEF